jgi:hypothetical protein
LAAGDKVSTVSKGSGLRAKTYFTHSVFTKFPFRRTASLPAGSRAAVVKRWEPNLCIAPIQYRSKVAEKLKSFLDSVCLLLFLAVIGMLLVLAVLPAEWF